MFDVFIQSYFFPKHRILDQQRTAVNKLKNSNGHLFNGAGDSLSWAEDISSISSAFISTKSEPPASRDRSLSEQQAASAQRDYRLQSYKCPQNFVLPELLKSNCDSSTTGVSIVSSASKRKQKPNAAHSQPLPETTVKVLETTVDSTSAATAANNRLLLSAVGDELQTNRLFVSILFNFLHLHSFLWPLFIAFGHPSFSDLLIYFVLVSCFLFWFCRLIRKKKENGITIWVLLASVCLCLGVAVSVSVYQCAIFSYNLARLLSLLAWSSPFLPFSLFFAVFTSALCRQLLQSIHHQRHPLVSTVWPTDWPYWC